MRLNPNDPFSLKSDPALFAFRSNRKGWTVELNASASEREQIKADTRERIKAAICEAVEKDQWTRAKRLIDLIAVKNRPGISETKEKEIDTTTKTMRKTISADQFRPAGKSS